MRGQEDVGAEGAEESVEVFGEGGVEEGDGACGTLLVMVGVCRGSRFGLTVFSSRWGGGECSCWGKGTMEALEAGATNKWIGGGGEDHGDL